MTTRSAGNKSAFPLVIVFVLLTVMALITRSQLEGWGVRVGVLLAGNAILFVVTLISLLLYQRAMLHPTTLGFLRNTYSGLFFKLLACAIAAVTYVLTDRAHVNKPALFACIVLYFLYTLLEMRSLLQWNKVRRNG